MIREVMRMAVRVQASDGKYYDIKLAPNQKVVTVVKSKPKGYILDIEANKLARKNLSSDAYSLYMHFDYGTISGVDGGGVSKIQ